MKGSEITLSDVARENCEVFVGALRVVSYGALTLALVGSLLLQLLRDQPHVLGIAITLGIPLLEHVVIEAGALLILAALVSSLRWHVLLGCGRTLVERVLLAIRLDDTPGMTSVPVDQLRKVDRVEIHSGAVVGRLLACLCVAPCAPPIGFHYADRPVCTLHHIRAEVP